jgi:hypothetical protein
MGKGWNRATEFFAARRDAANGIKLGITPTLAVATRRPGLSHPSLRGERGRDGPMGRLEKETFHRRLSQDLICSGGPAMRDRRA